MKRHIKVKINTEKNTLQVVEQTHRGNEFAKDGAFFEASNGFELISQEHPAIYSWEKSILYVRGEQKPEDNNTIHIPSKKWLRRCIKAICEYNRHPNT